VEQARSGEGECQAGAGERGVVDCAGKSRHAGSNDNASMHSVESNSHAFAHAACPSPNQHDDGRRISPRTARLNDPRIRVAMARYDSLISGGVCDQPAKNRLCNVGGSASRRVAQIQNQTSSVTQSGQGRIER